MDRTMKDSGVERIGKIPSDWRIVPLKYVVDSNLETLKEDTNEEYEFDYIDIGSVTYGKGIEKIEHFKFKNAPSRARRIVKHNDVILSTVRTYLKATAQIPKSDNPIIVSTGFIVLTAKKIMINEYLFFVIQSEPFICEVEAKSTGVSYPSINASNVLNMKIQLPPLEVQRKISVFLKERCNQVDGIISKTSASINDYKKYKQALITETATKGLKPDVPMKKSGVEYIGSIPSHWNIRKLRFLGSCQNGISKSGDAFGSGYPFVSYGDVYKNYALPQSVEGLIESTESDRDTYSVERGDVFFTRTSETIEEVGFASACLKTIAQATFAGFVIRFRPSDTTMLIPEFSKYYFRSDIHRKFFVKEMNLVTRASLSQELLKKMPVLLPPLSEQKKIAKYLDDKCFEIDNIIQKKETFILEMESYKKSLIYEYVTGKKEVR